MHTDVYRLICRMSREEKAGDVSSVKQEVKECKKADPFAPE